MDIQPILARRAQMEDFRRKHRTGLLTMVFTDLVGSTRRMAHRHVSPDASDSTSYKTPSETTIDSLDFISEMTDAAPFVIAVTAE